MTKIETAQLIALLKKFWPCFQVSEDLNEPNDPRSDRGPSTLDAWHAVMKDHSCDDVVKAVNDLTATFSKEGYAPTISDVRRRVLDIESDKSRRARNERNNHSLARIALTPRVPEDRLRSFFDQLNDAVRKNMRAPIEMTKLECPCTDETADWKNIMSRIPVHKHSKHIGVKP